MEALVVELVRVQRRVGEEWDERARKEVHIQSLKRSPSEADLRAALRESTRSASTGRWKRFTETACYTPAPP